MTNPIRMACYGTDLRIRPCAVAEYSGPAGIILGASPIMEDERGEYQLISYPLVVGFKIRVPPLHTWEQGYISLPEEEPPANLDLTPITE